MIKSVHKHTFLKIKINTINERALYILLQSQIAKFKYEWFLYFILNKCILNVKKDVLNNFNRVPLTSHV